MKGSNPSWNPSLSLAPQIVRRSFPRRATADTGESNVNYASFCISVTYKLSLTNLSKDFEKKNNLASNRLVIMGNMLVQNVSVGI